MGINQSIIRHYRCFNQNGHVTQHYISSQWLNLPLRTTWPNIWGTNYMFTKSNLKPTVRKALGVKKTPGMENLQPDPQNVYTPEKDDEQRFSHPTTLSHFQPPTKDYPCGTTNSVIF